MEPPEYTLPGIMNYLQSEFTQIEKMKIANNLELSEMKFKIAKLEGVKNALNATNNKLVDDLNGLQKDNKKLLSVIYNLKKENNDFKRQVTANSTKEANAELDAEKEKAESNKIDDELRELITGLSSTKSQSILIKDIKGLSLKSGTQDSDITNALDLTPLITSRKFLQDCMKEMFYLIKNGNGNIVNNINDFNFDNNFSNGDNDEHKNELATGNFGVFEKFNYITAEQQNEQRLENEQKAEEEQREQQEKLNEQHHLQREQQKQQRKQERDQRRQQLEQQQQQQQQAPQQDQQQLSGHSSESTFHFGNNTGDEKASTNAEGTDSQFTLLLRSPDLLKYPKLAQNSNANPSETGTSEEPKIREAPQIKPKQKLSNDKKGNNSLEGYYNIDSQSDAETIVDADGGDSDEDQERSEEKELDKKNASTEDDDSDQEEVDEDEEPLVDESADSDEDREAEYDDEVADDSIIDEDAEQRNAQLGVVNDLESVDEDEAQYLIELNEDNDSLTHKKIEPSSKLLSPDIPGLITNIVVNPKTNEILTVSSNFVELSSIDKNYKLTVKKNKDAKKIKVSNGKIAIKWINDDHFLIFDDKEPYDLKFYNKKTFEVAAKINVINDLKEQSAKEKKTRNRQENNSDSDDDEDEVFLPLRETTILSVDSELGLLLVNCRKFYYIYNVEDLTNIKLVKHESLLNNPGTFSTIKLGKFINKKEILILSSNGILKKINVNCKATTSKKEAEQIIFTINDLPSYKPVNFLNFVKITKKKAKSAKDSSSSADSQLMFVFENLYKGHYIYRLFDSVTNKLVDDGTLIIKHVKANNTNNIRKARHAKQSVKVVPSDPKNPFRNEIKAYYDQAGTLFLLENSTNSLKQVNLLDFTNKKLVAQMSYYDTDDIVPDDDDPNEKEVEQLDELHLSWYGSGECLLMTGVDSTIRKFEV